MKLCWSLVHADVKFGVQLFEVGHHSPVEFQIARLVLAHMSGLHVVSVFPRNTAAPAAENPDTTIITRSR